MSEKELTFVFLRRLLIPAVSLSFVSLSTKHAIHTNACSVAGYEKRYSEDLEKRSGSDWTGIIRTD